VDAPAPAAQQAVFSVTLYDAEKMISDALTAKSPGSQLHVILFGDRNHALGQSASIIKTDVQELQYEPASGRLSALLVFQTDGAALAPVRVNGRYEEMLNVPMLTHAIDNGVKISESDLVMTPFSSRRLHKDAIVKAEELVGKTPRRSIASNRPIRRGEIIEPADIRKGSQVTLKYESGGMEIHTLGEILEPGIIGRHVSVRNTASKAIVTGTLEDNNTVLVSVVN
jgi:flagella basal body P-ring formation protein FlgA